MVGFRRKIWVNYLVLLCVFFLLMIPLITKAIQSLGREALAEKAEYFIEDLQKCQSVDEMVAMLKEKEPLTIFKISLEDADGNILYASMSHSPLDHESKFVSYSQVFTYHGSIYHLKVSFPHKQVEELIFDFEVGFILISMVVLLAFSVLTLTLIHRMTKPVQKILDSIRPYQNGLLQTLPKIDLGEKLSSDDELVKLADTLNDLSHLIQNHISTITEERDEKEAILEALVEGVISIDREGNVEYVNAAAGKMLEIECDQIAGKAFKEVGIKAAYDLFEKCKNSHSMVADEIKKGKGEADFLAVVAIPKKANLGVLLVLHDRSSYYQLHQRGKAFVANASHELKTPITIIRGFAETLHDHPELPLTTKQEITAKIVSNCQRMNTLVRNLLTLADLEELPLSRLQEFSLAELANRCKGEVNQVYPHASIEISGDAIIVADPDLLERAITNLLDNAAKYSQTKPQIEVFIEKKDKLVSLVVQDHGIGIPKEDCDHVFERFYTVNKAHSRKLGGSGLGLSIVQTIVEKHGGKVVLESEVGKGSTFTITLPDRRDLML